MTTDETAATTASVVLPETIARGRAALAAGTTVVVGPATAAPTVARVPATAAARAAAATTVLHTVKGVRAATTAMGVAIVVPTAAAVLVGMIARAVMATGVRMAKGVRVVTTAVGAVETVAGSVRDVPRAMIALGGAMTVVRFATLVVPVHGAATTDARAGAAMIRRLAAARVVMTAGAETHRGVLGTGTGAPHVRTIAANVGSMAAVARAMIAGPVSAGMTAEAPAETTGGAARSMAGAVRAGTRAGSPIVVARTARTTASMTGPRIRMRRTASTFRIRCCQTTSLPRTFCHRRGMS